jgi:hypothetical protein
MSGRKGRRTEEAPVERQPEPSDEVAAAVQEILVGSGKTSMSPPEDFVKVAMEAAIPDPNPTVRLSITKELARTFLLRTNVNRKLWPGVVAWLAKQRKAGDWNDRNGDVVRFNTKGELIDGQHRIAMIFYTGLTTECDVKFNVPDTAQATIDVGRKRSVADQLHLLGEKHNTALSATIRWLYALSLNDTSYRANTQETLRFLEKNPTVRDSVALVHGTTSIKGTVSTLLAALHFIATHSLNEGEKANQMVEVFRYGREIYEGNPLHRLRESNMAMMSKRGAVLTQRAHMDNLIHAWNLFRKERTARYVKPLSSVQIAGFDPMSIGIDKAEAITILTQELDFSAAFTETMKREGVAV